MYCILHVFFDGTKCIAYCQTNDIKFCLHDKIKDIVLPFATDPKSLEIYGRL